MSSSNGWLGYETRLLEQYAPQEPVVCHALPELGPARDDYERARFRRWNAESPPINEDK